MHAACCEGVTLLVTQSRCNGIANIFILAFLFPHLDSSVNNPSKFYPCICTQGKYQRTFCFLQVLELEEIDRRWTEFYKSLETFSSWLNQRESDLNNIRNMGGSPDEQFNQTKVSHLEINYIEQILSLTFSSMHIETIFVPKLDKSLLNVIVGSDIL